MASLRVALCAVAVAACAVSVHGQAAPDTVRPPALNGPRVGLMDSVARVMRRTWPDSGERRTFIPVLLEEFRGSADSAATFGGEVAVVRRMLARIHKSHMGLTSQSASRSITRGYTGLSELTFGMQLMAWQGRWYATAVLDGGPAAQAGVRPWDEILALDGVTPAQSARLDWSTDDAALEDDRDPPVHPLWVGHDSTLHVRLRQRERDTLSLVIRASAYSAVAAMKQSLRVMELDGGVRVGVVHLWYMFTQGTSWFTSRFDNEWSDVDALVLDLRGRGGSVLFADAVAEALNDGEEQRFRGPLVVLQDRQTRSAKEVLLFHLRAREATSFVGEATAGAVLPSIAVPLGFGLLLTLPGGPLREYASLEGDPRQPTERVAWGGPLAAGDPIFEAGLKAAELLIERNGRGIVLPSRAAAINPAIQNTMKEKVRTTRPRSRP